MRGRGGLQNTPLIGWAFWKSCVALLLLRVSYLVLPSPPPPLLLLRLVVVVVVVAVRLRPLMGWRPPPPLQYILVLRLRGTGCVCVVVVETTELLSPLIAEGAKKKMHRLQEYARLSCANDRRRRREVAIEPWRACVFVCVNWWGGDGLQW